MQLFGHDLQTIVPRSIFQNNALVMFGAWINHLPSVCWSIFGKTILNEMACKFDRIGNHMQSPPSPHSIWKQTALQYVMAFA